MDPKYPGNTGFGTNTGAPSAGGMGSQVASRLGMTDESGNFDMHMLSQRAEEIGQRVTQMVRDRPVTCLLIAVGAGYLVGRLLRA